MRLFSEIDFAPSKSERLGRFGRKVRFAPTFPRLLFFRAITEMAPLQVDVLAQPLGKRANHELRPKLDCEEMRLESIWCVRDVVQPGFDLKRKNRNRSGNEERGLCARVKRIVIQSDHIRRRQLDLGCLSRSFDLLDTSRKRVV